MLVFQSPAWVYQRFRIFASIRRTLASALALALATTMLCLSLHAAPPAPAPPANVNLVDGTTSASAYQIASMANLLWLRDQTAGGFTKDKYYRLTADIDASDTINWNDNGTTTNRLEGFAPMGNTTIYFQGVLDGDHHKITGLVINRATSDYVGLFAQVMWRGVFNLALENCSIAGRDYVGTLAGKSLYARIENCSVSGLVTGENYVGGLVGSEGTFLKCRSSAAVTATGECVGGLVGGRCGITGSGATGAVTGTRMIGGLTGYAMENVADSYAMGNVTATNDFSGGLVGSAQKQISNCHATGVVVSTGTSGGLAAGASGAVENCYATGPVTGDYAAGGLLGNASAPVTRCYSTGSVFARRFAGGLASFTGSTISNCYATGDVVVVPVVWNLDISVGGFTGVNSGSITNCYASGRVTMRLTPPFNYSGNLHTGGLVGNQSGAVTLRNSFANGPVAVVSATDGTPVLPATAHVGGLNGSFSDDAQIFDSYWDVQSSGQATSAGGTGLTTLQLRQPTNLTSWDFNEIWAVQGGYPYLRSFPTCMLTYQAGVHGRLSDGLTYGSADVVQIINRASRTVSISAVPEANFLFAHWSDNALANPRSDAGVTTNLTVTALYFSPTLLPNLRCAELPITINHRPTWFWNSYQGATIFRYQLDGQSDSAWTVTSVTSWIPATSLPLGTHTLYVQELNLSGQWSFSAQSTIRISATTATQHWSAYE